MTSMFTARTLIACLGAAAAAAIAMAWLSFARAGADELRASSREMDAAVGKALFERLWVAAPASTEAADGLGPLFNARSCAACHKEGRSALIWRDGERVKASGLVVRVASPNGAPHPEFGVQLQDRALPGLASEARVEPRLDRGTLKVEVTFERPPHSQVVLEARLAPSLEGRALLELVDEQAVLALADPDDSDGDGISGRPHFIEDANGNRFLGRYGAKATVRSLAMQTAEAAATDMGLSSPFVRRAQGDCTVLQPDCIARPSGRSVISDGEEISADVIRLITSHLRRLEAPTADIGSDGFRAFASAGCAACHVPSLPARDGTSLQVFTDLLLHDLGPEGASTIREGSAAPAEWRTAPLRDLAPRNGARRYMRDGRAATLREAILHHGGEAAAARAAFSAANGRDQQLLLDFLAKL